MDRLLRPTLLVIAAAAAALAAREAMLRPRAPGEPNRLTNAASVATPIYPPRILELPEGVVPVALNFAPPPVTPLDGSERQIVESRAADVMNSLAPELQRLPPVKAPAFPASEPAEFSLTPPSRAGQANATQTPPWLAPPLQPGVQDSAAGPELTEPRSDFPSRERSIITRVPSIERPPAPPAVAAGARPDADDPLLAVDNRARRMVDHAFSVAQRGAVYTARAELIQSLRMLAQSLDAAAGTQAHTESLAAAFRALEEGESFHTHSSRPDTAPNLKSLVGGHRTPVLKDADLERLTAVEAMQRYYTYAQEQFAAAAERRPAASLALYGLGKLHMAMSEKPGSGAAMDLPKALVFHQAAIVVDPQNHLAANELGVLLARYEQWEQAKHVFLHSLAVHPLPQTWHNLAVVHDHLGETSLGQQARFEMKQLAGSSPAAALPGSGHDVRWLSPSEFAATGEGRGAIAVEGEPAAAMHSSSAPQPGGIEWWKPWTWF